MKLFVDDAIFKLQPNGGITRLWNELMPRLKEQLPKATWDDAKNCDLFISTYYNPAMGRRSLVVAYDFIHERYPTLGRFHTDAVAKRLAISEANSVVAISQFTAADCLKITGRKATVAYCGGGEKFSRTEPSEVNEFQMKYGILKPYVLVVGRRGSYKNIQSLYQAWALWPAAKDHALVCVGGESRLPEDVEFSRRYPNVHHVLSLSDEELAAAYSGASALVYPSIWEGFGLPILEALACGCPVVMGDNGAGKEITNGAHIPCNPLLPFTIASGLSTALEPQARLQVALAGYQRAKLFTWEKTAKIVADVIRNMVL